MGDYSTKKIGDMEGFYKGLFRKARDEIGATSFGLAVIELEPNADNHPDHDHPDQEEVYVVLRGAGELLVDGESVPLDSETIVRIGPNTRRKINPGAEGMRLLAIGGVPGQAYQAPGYSEVGAPDPLA